jgi:hypothetical protein
MDRFVGGRKYCINDMRSLDLNSQVKEIDILKQTAEILKVSKADAPSVCFKIIVQVKEMREGLGGLNILHINRKPTYRVARYGGIIYNLKSLF